MLGIGIDSVEIERFRALLARRPNISDRLFTKQENEYSLGFADPATRLAARFAAKEAAMKAMSVGLGAVSFLDIEVVSLSNGAPELKISGKAAAVADSRGIKEWKVSITHTNLTAEAVVAVL